MEKVKAWKDAESRKKNAFALALPAYRRIRDAYVEGFTELLGTVSTKGGLATIMFWEHGFYPVALERTGRELAEVLGTPLPADLTVPVRYRGPPRLIVPTVRSVLTRGEPLRLPVCVLSISPPERLLIKWRRLGEEEFSAKSVKHVARGVYDVTLLPEEIPEDFEYHVELATAEGAAVFPPTAPNRCQSVVIAGTRVLPRRGGSTMKERTHAIDPATAFAELLGVPRVTAAALEDDGSIPNNPRLPALLYRGALKKPDPATFEQVFSANRWGSSWRKSSSAPVRTSRWWGPTPRVSRMTRVTANRENVNARLRT